MIDELVQRYKSGEYGTAVGRDYKISESGRLKLVRAEGVALRMQPITPEDEQKAVKLYESASSTERVVEKVGYPYGTILLVLHENDVAVRAGGSGTRSVPRK